MTTFTNNAQRTRIKICGITRADDAYQAIALGADALGFVFYEKSRRAVTTDDIAWIKQLPPFTQLVGLFVNPSHDFVQDVISALPIELLQFHGQETPDFCQQFHQRYVKAVPMQGKNVNYAKAYMGLYGQASAFLLDNYGAGEIGGSGTAFDWSQIPSDCPAPLVMAGGLHAENVGEVIRHCSPYGVDVSSGVESEPGVKSADKMAAFIRAVNTLTPGV